MNFLLPQTRTGAVHHVRHLEIHGDRYIDVALLLDDGGDAPVSGRVSALECAADLQPGERVEVGFTLGVMTRVTRT